MTLDEKLAIYLPKYLSADNYRRLLDELKCFPNNINGCMYSHNVEEKLLYQGDVIDLMPVVNVEDINKGEKKCACIILSNTCDINPENERLFHSRIMYAPLISIEKYTNVLNRQQVSPQKINEHIRAIKNQELTQIIYLPKTQKFDESIVFLDRTLNIKSDCIDRNSLDKLRLSSFSDYGFYLFLFKISVHFCRIMEGMQRGQDFIET